MSRYHRHRMPGGLYFFTVVTHRRYPWLCEEASRAALRDAIKRVRSKRPFTVEAWVLLRDHFHCIWRLPEGDADFSTRMRLIKTAVTRHPAMKNFEKGGLHVNDELGAQRASNEGLLWQRRFWEHAIRDDKDFENHCDYIHYNPVKHGLCDAPMKWPYSSFHRFVEKGLYPLNWAATHAPVLPEPVGKE